MARYGETGNDLTGNGSKEAKRSSAGQDNPGSNPLKDENVADNNPPERTGDHERTSGHYGGGRPSGGRDKIRATGEPWKDKCRTVSQDEIPVSKMREMQLEELLALAASEQVESVPEKGKSRVIEAIVRNRVSSQGFQWGGGTLEVLRDGFGFLRQASNCYQSGDDDIYVSPSQVRRFGLRNGSSVFGQIRAPKTGEGYPALLRVEMVDGMGPFDSSTLVPFENLVPMHPRRKINLNCPLPELSTRVVDLLAPAGFGQRSLIVSPPRAGKTVLIQALASAITRNHPDVWVTMLLIDERPEEVTEMRRTLASDRCEILASTFDQPAQAHAQLVELVMNKSRRMVEAGVDVVVFLDSLTRLSRAWNSMQPEGGKTLTGGLDAAALDRPKAFFGSARETERGGSLTVFATALIDTGSQMDQVIFEEFQGTGNMEIVLSRGLADLRIWPSIDLSRSGTRREEMMRDERHERVVVALRKKMMSMNDQDAMRWLLVEIGRFPDNDSFLDAFSKTLSDS